MKKRYLIKVQGIFLSGYYIHTWSFSKNGTTICYNNEKDLIKDATKFRFKFFARFIIYLLKKESLLNTYSIETHYL